MKELMGHVYKAMVNQNITTSWYHRPADVTSFAPEEAERQRERQQSHPSNVANAKRKLVLSRTLERLKAENQAWNAQLQRCTHLAQTPVADLSSRGNAATAPDVCIESTQLSKSERRMWQLCQQLKETRLDANDTASQAASPPPLVTPENSAGMSMASLSTSSNLCTLKSFAMNTEPIVDQLTHCAYLARMLNTNLTTYLDTTTARVIRSLMRRTQGSSNLPASTNTAQPLLEGAPEEQQAKVVLAADLPRIDATNAGPIESSTDAVLGHFASIDPQDILRGLSRLLPRSSK
ncbi:hypothetical protein H4R34_005470 [Dimargaris verticillata]|uniref:Uncharacterized protein n=1 Tax=Dimargaris verticillata TaxID=2761393 RepID=A0A9W8B2V8_9FUNG|nr:hypothetical protein H4R34_005470 [Dimargaris verticillata]